MKAPRVFLTADIGAEALRRLADSGFDVGLTPGDGRLIQKLRLFNHLGLGTYETRLSADPNVGMAGRAVQPVIDRLSGADPRGMALVVNRHDLGSLENG